MLRHLALIALVVAAYAAERLRFENHQVYRIVPCSNEQLELLRRLQHEHEGYSYWIEPSRVFQAADLMVSPSKQTEFAELMDAADMRYATYVENVQSLIDRENGPENRPAGFNWTRYHTLQEIYGWLESVAKAHPDRVEVVDAGRSYEGRAIKGVKLSSGATRPGVFVEGGIHAREWISPATVTYLIDALLTSDEPKVRQLAQDYDWYIFPVFNPDGYVYTHQTDRTWRKTRSPNNGTSCFGADPNRNWGFKWMHGDASSDPCVNTYAGSSAFSEAETKSMSEYVRSISDKLFGYIAFHSAGQVLMFPYGYTPEHLDNYEESKFIALMSVEALSRRYGTEYRTGSIYETMYLSSGSSLEWVKAALELPLTFAYELRDQGKYGFLLPAEQIVPNSREVLDSLVGMLAEAARMGYPSLVGSARPRIHL